VSRLSHGRGMGCGRRDRAPADSTSLVNRCILILTGGHGRAELAARITVDLEQCGGRPCVRGMRIRVTDVLELFAAGLTAEQILDEMPDLEPEDLRACLQFAARWLDHPILVA